MKNLDKIFNPKKIVVVGASDSQGSVGGAIFRNIIKSKYKGKAYPVNTKRDKVLGQKAYKKISDIPDKLDLAIIATPASTVAGVLRECGQAKIGGAVIVSSGFSELGKSGEVMSAEIRQIAQEYNISILGPNCLGFIRPKIDLNASFTAETAHKGKIAFISQSGALCSSILDWSRKNNVGFSYFVSVGEMAGVGFHDLIDYFGKDPETESILIYMESLKEARKFMSAARLFSRTKPIVVLKAGRSDDGARAAKSHTGSLAGNDAVFNAAFERAGIIRVDTIVGLFHVAKLLAMQAKPVDDKLIVITNAGGPGVITADAISYSMGEMVNIQKSTVNKLNKILPASWSHGNPVDILGDADAARYRQTLEICLEDNNANAILIILTPQAMTDPTGVAREIVKVKNKTNKTILASWMGGEGVLQGRQILEAGNIPIYRSPEDAINSFSCVYKYTKNLQLLNETPATIPHAFVPKTEANKKIILEAMSEQRFILNEAESKKILENYGIPIVPSGTAKEAREAAILAAKIGFPVAMKILSSRILHKSDVGGVRLNIKTEEEAVKAFNKIIDSVRSHEPQADIEGVFIERMVKKKYELIIGCKKDPVFGPVIVFGMGGLAVEVFKDTRVGLPPLNMSLAMQLIKETKIYKLLKGYRNIPGVDIQAIQFLLYKFSYLISDFPEIKELDINPFAVDQHGGIVLDAKIILDENLAGQEIEPYSHLSISPYPKEYNKKIKIDNGKSALIRAILPEDEPSVVEMFGALSKKIKQCRFFETIKDITREELNRFTQIDYDREIVLAIEIGQGKNLKFIALARLVADPFDKSAEFAVVVSDEWQKEKIGGRFVDYVMLVARERGIKKLVVNFYKFNKIIAHILKKRGFTVTSKGKNCIAELELM